MSSTDTVTAWIRQLQNGQESALRKLHQRYWPWLVALARKKLKGVRLHEADEEDVAQAAFVGFYQTFQAGGAPQLANRQDLLALLSTITACKAINQIQREVGVQKRGGGQLQGESALQAVGDSVGGALERFADAGRTPLEEVILHDQYQQYIHRLPEKLHDFAELYLAGCTQREIADQLQCGLRTVERKIALVLTRWQEMALASVNTV